MSSPVNTAELEFGALPRRQTPAPAPSRGGVAPPPQLLETLDLDIDEARQRTLQRLEAFVLPMIGLGIFVGLWSLYTHLGNVTLPGPLATLQGSWNLIAHPFFDNGPNDKGLGLHILASLGRVAIGYSLAALVGVSLGLLVGKSKLAQGALDPIFQVLRTIPPLAWLPLSLAIFSQAQPSAIFVIFITALWPILINTAVGVSRIHQDYENVAAIYQLKGWKYFRLILLPAAAPYIFTGLRISIGMAWLAIVAAEMLTGGVGIGFFIWDSWNSSHLSDIIVSIAYVGGVGFTLDKLVAYAGARFGAKQE
jgi:nitrate/nitrite transport system permease protein